MLRFGEPTDYVEVDESASESLLPISTKFTCSVFVFLERIDTNCCLFQKANVFSLSVKEQHLFVMLRTSEEEESPLTFETGIKLPSLVRKSFAPFALPTFTLRGSEKLTSDQTWMNITCIFNGTPTYKRQKLTDEDSPRGHDEQKGRCTIYINGALAWKSCKLVGYVGKVRGERANGQDEQKGRCKIGINGVRRVRRADERESERC